MKKFIMGLIMLNSVATFAAPQIDCAITAQEKLTFNGYAISSLCSGAKSSAPVECALKAKEKLNFNAYAIAMLCSGATSNAPVDCAVEATTNTKLNMNAYAIAGLCGKSVFPKPNF